MSRRWSRCSTSSTTPASPGPPVSAIRRRATRAATLRMMVDKKMLDMKDLRIIWKSRPILNGPLTVRKSTPASYQADMLAFHLRAADGVSGRLPHVRHGQRQGLGAGEARGLPGVHRHAAAGGGGAPATGERRVAASLEAAFQARRRARLRRRRAAAVRAAARAACCSPPWVSEAYPVVADRRAPRIGEYFDKLLPDLRLAQRCSPARRRRDRSPIGSTGSTAGSGCCSRPARWRRWRRWAARRWRCCCAFPPRANLAPNRATHFAFRRAAGTVPHRAGHRLRADPGVDVRRRPARRHSGDRTAHRGRAGKAVRRGGGECRHAAVGGACARPAATGSHAVRFAILPQVLPNFLSYVLLRFEINVRGATVIGFVGAGGIGQELYFGHQLQLLPGDRRHHRADHPGGER